MNWIFLFFCPESDFGQMDLMKVKKTHTRMLFVQDYCKSHPGSEHKGRSDAGCLRQTWRSERGINQGKKTMLTRELKRQQLSVPRQMPYDCRRGLELLSQAAADGECSSRRCFWTLLPSLKTLLSIFTRVCSESTITSSKPRQDQELNLITEYAVI